MPAELCSLCLHLFFTLRGQKSGSLNCQWPELWAAPAEFAGHVGVYQGLVSLTGSLFCPMLLGQLLLDLLWQQAPSPASRFLINTRSAAVQKEHQHRARATKLQSTPAALHLSTLILATNSNRSIHHYCKGSRKFVFIQWPHDSINYIVMKFVMRKFTTIWDQINVWCDLPLEKLDYLMLFSAFWRTVDLNWFSLFCLFTWSHSNSMIFSSGLCSSHTTIYCTQTPILYPTAARTSIIPAFLPPQAKPCVLCLASFKFLRYSTSQHSRL